MHGSGEGCNGKWWKGSRLWAPALANLLIGVIAVVPGACVWWLAMEYPSLKCTPTSCIPDATEPLPVLMFGAVFGGLIILGLALVVDFLMPRQEGERPHRWLGAAVLIPVPFAVGQAMGWLW